MENSKLMKKSYSRFAISAVIFLLAAVAVQLFNNMVLSRFLPEKFVESSIYEKTYPYRFVKYPLTLKSDEYFVMVDAREHGEDSRFFGPVKKSDIDGLIVGIYRRTGF